MELKYRLRENDYLLQQVYMVSKSRHNKKQNKLGLQIITLFLLMIAFSLYANEIIFLSGVFGAIAVICIALLLFDKKMSLKQDERKFKKYAFSKFQKNKDLIINLIFNEDSIQISTVINDVQFNFSGFKNVSETKDYFFVNLKTNDNIIIPKIAIENIEGFKCKLQTITKKMEIDFLSELDWDGK